MRRQKPKVKTAQAKQRAALALRSGGRCEMETRLMPGIWARCGRWATDPAHVYTRPKCGRARDSVDVVIHACRRCHDLSKGKLYANNRRVPLLFAQRAWNRILDASRLGADFEDRLRIHIGSVGPYPTKGDPPYEDDCSN